MAVGSVLRANRLVKKRLIKTAISLQHRGRAKPQRSLSRGSNLQTTKSGWWFVCEAFFLTNTFLGANTRAGKCVECVRWVFFLLNRDVAELISKWVVTAEEMYKGGKHSGPAAWNFSLRGFNENLSLSDQHLPWHTFYPSCFVLPGLREVSSSFFRSPQPATMPVPPYGLPSVHHLARCSCILYRLCVFLSSKVKLWACLLDSELKRTNKPDFNIHFILCNYCKQRL